MLEIQDCTRMIPYKVLKGILEVAMYLRRIVKFMGPVEKGAIRRMPFC